MKKFIEYFAELTDDQLERAYGEYQTWCKKGILYDGELRSVYDKYNEENETDALIYTITEPFLNELIKRYRMRLGK